MASATKQALLAALSAAQGECISGQQLARDALAPVSYTHLRAHETDSYLECRLLLEKKKNNLV